MSPAAVSKLDGHRVADRADALGLESEPVGRVVHDQAGDGQRRGEHAQVGGVGAAGRGGVDGGLVVVLLVGVVEHEARDAFECTPGEQLGCRSANVGRILPFKVAK